MKKLVSLVLIAVAAAMISGCSVASNTAGTITVFNSTGTDAKNVKVGDTYFGTVSKGQTITYSFYTAKNGAEVVAEGFDPEDDFLGNERDGKIDLKLGYMYSLSIYENASGDDVFSISGSKVDDDDSEIME